MLSDRPKITLKDLAAKTGVSPTAISYVLNGRHDRVRVSDKTKARVKAAAKEMGYVPRFSARAMVSQKSFCVAVLCSLAGGGMAPATAIYYANALQGVEEICKQAGYHCIYASCGLGDAESFAMPRLMKDGSVDGVIIVGHANAEVARHLKSMGLPCVQVGSNIDPSIGIEAVYPDLNQGLELASRMLADLGHHRVELILPTGPGPDMHMAHFLSLAKKIKSFRPLSGMLKEEWGSPAGGEERAKFWLARSNRPTAFMCSPIHAEGLIKGFAAAGMDFPRDYSLVVFLPQESGQLHMGPSAKPITTVTFPIHQIARRAALKLFERLGVPIDQGNAKSPSTACTLNPGESCAPPAIA
jgi:LacI family transcriptional regulator